MHHLLDFLLRAGELSGSVRGHELLQPVSVPNECHGERAVQFGVLSNQRVGAERRGLLGHHFHGADSGWLRIPDGKNRISALTSAIAPAPAITATCKYIENVNTYLLHFLFEV
jgi:hypothetical protein